MHCCALTPLQAKFPGRSECIACTHSYDDDDDGCFCCRCGMVYCDSEELKWMPYVKTWMNDVCADLLREDTQEYLLNLFAKYVENGLRFVSKKCVQAIAQVSLANYM